MNRESPSLIPRPTDTTILEGHFLLRESLSLVADECLENEVQYFESPDSLEP